MPLPQSVQEVADIIGQEKALRLIGQLPQCGKRSWRRALYVPTPARLRPGHRLIGILGEEDAHRLCRALGGTLLQPSANLTSIRRYRDDSLRRQRAEGASLRVLACVFDLSPRQVRNILAAG